MTEYKTIVLRARSGWRDKTGGWIEIPQRTEARIGKVLRSMGRRGWEHYDRNGDLHYFRRPLNDDRVEGQEELTAALATTPRAS